MADSIEKSSLHCIAEAIATKARVLTPKAADGPAPEKRQLLYPFDGLAGHEWDPEPLVGDNCL